MDTYQFLNIPDACLVGSTIYKKLFYENAGLSSADKALFKDVISKVTWLYCLKPDTINISAYKDEVRDYPEIEVLEVQIHKEQKQKRIAEIIMRTIPYPMLLIFRWEDKIQLFLAHQKINQNDSSKNTIEEWIWTDWLEPASDLLAKMDIKQMRFTNLFTLYSDMVDLVSIHKLLEIMPKSPSMTGAEARAISAQIEGLEGEIASLRAKLKKESQFNRRMELNIEIKKIEAKKNKVLEGDL